MQNTLKKKWAEGLPVTNAWVSSPSAWNVEILASTGFDAITIDTQHGLSADLNTLIPMLQAMRASSSTSFVRLPANDPAYIMRMLDAGVEGLICPMLNNAKETDAFVRATKYYPDGNRSIGPTRASVVFDENYLQTANQHNITFAMIETPDALKNMREMAQVEHLNGFYVGPWDLSASLGYKKLANFKDPSFMQILKEILAVAEDNHLITGIHAGNPKDYSRI
jgi:4-hydroxy-2-oxoheptanedioate aldolase